MEEIIRRIHEMVEPKYRDSAHYRDTIWGHALGVSKHAGIFARQLEVNVHVARVGGLLHDLGAAIHGKEDHHITGVRHALPILRACAWPQELIWPVVQCIYSHRASNKKPFAVKEAECVAAADAMDHFLNVPELWLVCRNNWNVPEDEIPEYLMGKLDRSWQKLPPEIQAMLGDALVRAKDYVPILARNPELIRNRA